MGERVEFAGVSGYLATGEGAGLGVLVLLPETADVSDRFAAEGFTALAPDVPTDDVPRAARTLTAAVDYLVEHRAVRGHGIAVVGYGVGGGLALWLASLRPDQVRAVVPFYGETTAEEAQPAWDRVVAPVEGHFGAGDEWAGKVEGELQARGREVRMFVYPELDGDAERQAWVRTLEFLRAKLG